MSEDNVPQTHEPFKLSPDDDGMMSIRSVIGQALGAASVAWFETPTSEFDSTFATEIITEVCALLEGAGIDCEQRIRAGTGSG